MEIRQLHYVLAVAREQNFTRAAHKLMIAQPSLSQQIAKLEQEIGLPLFTRTKNKVECTYAGQLFVERAQKIIDMFDQLKIEMADVGQLKKGRLVVGSLPITGSHVMPVILPKFRELHPDIEVVLVEDTTANLEILAANGDTDLSLLSLPIANDQLAYEPLLDEAIMLAVPPTHPLAQQANSHHRNSHHSNSQTIMVHPTIALSQLQNEPFIVLKKGQGFRQITFDLCQQAGFAPHIVFESNNIETIQSLVAAGMGLAFVPQMVMRPVDRPHSPFYFSISDKGASRSLVIGYRKQRYLSNAAQAFIATVQDIMKTSPVF